MQADLRAILFILTPLQVHLALVTYSHAHSLGYYFTPSIAISSHIRTRLSFKTSFRCNSNLKDVNSLNRFVQDAKVEQMLLERERARDEAAKEKARFCSL